MGRQGPPSRTTAVLIVPAADETSKAEKRAIGDYYYMGGWDPCRRPRLARLTYVHSGRDEQGREARYR